jgi:phenylalanyl-tRNA synthetase beta chain
MKFCHAMMRDYIASPLSSEELGDLLTMAGFELEDLVAESSGESILDVKVMSNRGDGLSVFGLAREVRAKLGADSATELFSRAWTGFKSALSTELPDFQIEVQSEDCRRFAGVVIHGVRNLAGPSWISSRLEHAGIRSISELVDLTNYVMLELGQPLHAYDLGKLGNRIVVRKAKFGETLKTLDGVERELREGQLMICDSNRPIGVAGVMGGLETEVDEHTTSIFLESANFLNTSIRRTRKQLGLNTEASYRFERSVDVNLVDVAIRRFAELLRVSQPEIQVSAILDWYPRVALKPEIHVDMSRVKLLLGMPVTSQEAERHLELLGFEVMSQDPLRVRVPSWRPDVVREEDVIEEIGRVHGYERIPEELPSGKTVFAGVSGNYRSKELLVQLMVGRGFTQCVSHSLRSLHPLDDRSGRIGPRNPGSPEHAYLRNSLLPSLAEAALRNGGKDLQFFEVGNVFSSSEGNVSERERLAIFRSGLITPLNRATDLGVAVDFFALKSDIEVLSQTLGVSVYYRPLTSDARFHPGRCAEVLLSHGEKCGVLGQIHPIVAEEVGLDLGTVMGEIDLNKMLEEPANAFAYRSISRNPAVRRDIAVIIDQAIPYFEVERAIMNAGAPSLERHWLFDVYSGPGVGEGKHSLGIGLQFRRMNANLTDDEANRERDLIVEALESLGAKLR